MTTAHTTARPWVCLAKTDPAHQPDTSAPDPRRGSQPALLQEARGRITLGQQRKFLDRLAEKSRPALADLTAPARRESLRSGVWSSSVRTAFLTSEAEHLMTRANMQRQLLTDSARWPHSMSQVVLWEQPEGRPEIARTHVAALDDTDPATLVESALPSMRRRGCRTAEVRVGWDHPELAESLRRQSGWSETPLEGGDLLFSRGLSSIPGEE